MDFAQGPRCAAHPARREKTPTTRHIRVRTIRVAISESEISESPYPSQLRREKAPTTRRDAHGARTDLRPRPARPAHEPSRFLAVTDGYGRVPARARDHGKTRTR